MAKVAADAPILLVCGLGNPGAEYEKTRHNAGFLVVDALANELGARYWKTKPGALTCEVTVGGRKVILAKPTSYMNVCGGPLRNIAAEIKAAPAQVLVVHDDLELAPGKVAVKMGGGLAGHNGLRSLNDKFGTPEFPRVRLGIGRPPGRQAVADYVLRQMKGRDWEDFELTVADGAVAVRMVLEGGVAAGMQRYTGK